MKFRFVTILALAGGLCLASQPTPLPKVEFVVEGKGSFVMEIRVDQAPKIGGHFLSLVKSGFYDGQLFHRKVNNFVLQGGDPGSKKFTSAQAKAKPGEMGGTRGLGDGGSGKDIPYEINDLTHEKYSVGMALEAPMSDTGDSQFFINLKDNFRLNGMYCVFGSVVKGRELINKIDRGDRIVSVKAL